MKSDYEAPTHWKCLNCGYLITNTEMQLLRCNVGCPRCLNSLENFTCYDMEENEGKALTLD